MARTAEMSRYRIGDRVIVDPGCAGRWLGVVFTVKRILQVNVVIEPVGGGRGVRIRPELLLPAPPEGEVPDRSKTRVPGATVVSTADSVTIIPNLPRLPVGAFVTVSHVVWSGGDGVFVVLKDKLDTVSLAATGGNDDRYWPRVPRAWVTQVEVELRVTGRSG